MEPLPINEFDADEGIIHPSQVLPPGLSAPERCVMPIYGSVVRRLRDEGRLELIYDVGRVFENTWGIYKLEHGGEYITVAHPGIGCAMATTLMEELYALDCRKFVACGAAGVLDDSLEHGAVVIPSAALRDEGTSYHYLPPSRTVEADPAVVSKLEAVLEKHGVPYETGLTWTTDGLFRETKERIARRKAEGCIAVEMECAGFLAVAKYRGVAFGQYLGVSDYIGGDAWDPRRSDERLTHEEKLFWLSVEACLEL